jgi:glycosyltransferase involved in cell wall biosynthesis
MASASCILKELEPGGEIMRILFVTNNYPTPKAPGDSPCVEQQKQSLEDLGIEVDVLFFDGMRNRLNYLKGALRVFWNVQIRRRYDLIHAHYGFSGAVARMQTSCPVIVTFRGSDVLTQRERPVSQWVATKVDRVIVMTKEMKRVLGRKDALVLPYGLDVDTFKPCPQDAARRELGLPMNSPLILFPYNPQRRIKRFDLVQQAATILSEKFPGIQVLAIHDKPQKMVATYMNACDVMILASESEGAPGAIREAMACNLPIVSVDVGDVADLIRDIEGCYICKKTPSSIAAEVTKALTLRKRSNGCTAASQFDLKKTAFALFTVYNEVLKERQLRNRHWFWRSH